jgi:ADP-heptose:LPS heptosyltransferase
MTLLSGAKTTICFSGNDECIHDSMRFTNNNYYSRIINVDDHTNEGEKYSKLFGDLSIQQITTSQFKVIEPSNLESTSKITFLARKPYMVFAPGSSSNKRIWSPRRYSTLINEVLHKSDLNVVICGSKSEESLLKNLTINENNRIIIAAGYPLVEIFFLMKEAKLFIGNDSGLLHFAAVLGIPSIGIIGGGHYCRYFPYGNAKIVTNFLPCFECNWRCIHSTPLCLTQISVDDVFSEVEKLLG